MYLIANITNAFRFARAFLLFLRDERKRGTLKANFRSLAKTREIEEDMSWAELVEEKVRKYGDRVFLMFEGGQFTYRQMDENANRIANYLKSLGGGRGKGLAIMMGNCPQYLDIFIGSQKIGMHSIPINTSLRGDSLLHILNHSEAEFIMIDKEILDVYRKIADRTEKIQHVVVNRPSGAQAPVHPPATRSLAEAYLQSPKKPAGAYGRDDICFILYTSGTTGLPKGVMYRYGKTTAKLLSIPAYAMYRKSDILYTGIPLFHGNALWLTVTVAMHRGAKVALARKFSASRFWDDIRTYHVTAFNTIGAIIPILMKQHPKENDRDNRVRFTLSAACPVDDWEKFEKLFGIKIYEGYGAMDGGGKSIMNMGNAPVGSIGMPNPGGCILTDTAEKPDILSGKARGGKYGVPRVATTRKGGATPCVACFDCGAACPHGAISIKQNFNSGYHFMRLTQKANMRYPKRY